MFSDENFLFLGVSHPKNAADAKLMLKKDEEIHQLNSNVQSLVRVIACQLTFIPSAAFSVILASSDVLPHCLDLIIIMMYSN